jgi:NAD(P)H-quinone oxidoreductase subunit 5
VVVPPTAFRLWRYRFAMERGNLDTILDEWIASPFVKMFRWFDKLEHSWIKFLSGHRRVNAHLADDANESEAS